MAAAAKKLDISVPTDLQFTVRPAPFESNGNLKFLDLGKLRSRRCRLEVGQFKGGCCATKLYAVVERGMVVRLELEKHKGSKRPPPFLKDVLAKAVEALRASSSSESEPIPLPMPVEDFIQAMQTGTSGTRVPPKKVCFSLEWNIPFVGKRWAVCCVSWYDQTGKIIIVEAHCGDWLSFYY